MAEPVKRKSGAVKSEDYEDEAFIQSLGPVSAKLQAQFPSGKFDVKSTSQFAAQIQQLTEDVLGIKSLPPRPFPKPPTSIFRDVKPDGSLHLILARFQQLMMSRSLKRVDFSNPYHRKQFQEMLGQTVSELIKKGFLKYPKVFLHPSCGPDLPSLTSMVTSLKGEIASKQDEDGVTHVVKPFGPSGDPDDGVQYMRNLGVKGQKAKVHWWYFPDSYDEYVLLDDAPEVIELDKEATGPWNVYTRWVKDSAKYNEWMNPIDYEVDDTPAKPLQQATAAGAQKQDAALQSKSVHPVNAPMTSAQAPSAAAALQPRPAPVVLPEVALNEGKEIQPGVIQQKLVVPDARAFNTSSLAMTVAAPSTATGVAPEKVAYRVPAYAHWFDPALIHAREKAACPSCFKEQTTGGQDYMTIRSAIIDAYKSNPGRFLWLDSLQEVSPDNEEMKAEIWRFLICWGIINFQAKAATPPQADIGGERAETPVVIDDDDDGDDEDNVPNGQGNSRSAETMRKAILRGQRLLKSYPLPGLERGFESAMGSACLPESSKKRKREDQSIEAQAPEERLFHEARYFCSVMPEVECTDLRYHCTKLPGLDLCPKAFANGQFPAGCTAKDFIRIDRKTVAADCQAWSDQDTLLLLEGLELFKDNWADIAEHVGKSQVQCIAHFLSLPLEDAILDDIEFQELANSTADGSKEIPFSTHGNPIMALMAFLTIVVGPEVGAAAAKSALEVLLADDADSSEGRIEGNLLKQAASVSLEAAAMKAKLLADHEEVKIRGLLTEAVEAQVKLNKLRLKGFGNLENALNQEHNALKGQREALSNERLIQQNQLKRTLGAQPVVPAFIPSSAPAPAYAGVSNAAAGGSAMSAAVQSQNVPSSSAATTPGVLQL